MRPLPALAPTLGVWFSRFVAMFDSPQVSPQVSPSASVRSVSPDPDRAPPPSHSFDGGVPGRHYPARPSVSPRSPVGSSDDQQHAAAHPVPPSVDVGDNWVVLPYNDRSQRGPILQFWPRDPDDGLSSWYYRVLISDGVVPHTVFLTFNDAIWDDAPDLTDCFPGALPDLHHPPHSFHVDTASGWLLPHGCIWSSSDFP